MEPATLFRHLSDRDALLLTVVSMALKSWKGHDKRTFRLKTAYLGGTEKSIQGLAFAPFIRNIASDAGVELGGALKDHGGCLVLT